MGRSCPDSMAIDPDDYCRDAYTRSGTISAPLSALVVLVLSFHSFIQGRKRVGPARVSTAINKRCYSAHNRAA